MQKLDLAKRHKKYYSAARAPEVIGIEPAEFLTIIRKEGPSGRGTPGAHPTLVGGRAAARTRLARARGLGLRRLQERPDVRCAMVSRSSHEQSVLGRHRAEKINQHFSAVCSTIHIALRSIP